jgi:hypothetical protein
MDEKFTVWYCDYCESPIDDPGDAVVVRYGHDLKIWHKSCMNKRDESLHFEELCHFCNNPSCIADLLADISPNIVDKSNGPIYDPKPSLDSICELIRRLYVPHYEEARLYFPDLADPNVEIDCPQNYSRENLEMFIKEGKELNYRP